MTALTDLLPCPFCGGRAVQKSENDPDLIEWGYVICSDCCGRTRGKWGELCPQTWQEIRDEWNTRATHPAPLALSAEEREALNRMESLLRGEPNVLNTEDCRTICAALRRITHPGAKS